MVLSDSDGDSVDPFKTKSVSEIFGDSDSGDDTDDMIKKSAPITNRLQKKRPRLDSSSDESSEDEARKAERRKRKLEKAARKKRKKEEKRQKKLGKKKDGATTDRVKSLKEEQKRREEREKRRKEGKKAGEGSGDSYESEADVKHLSDDDFLDSEDDQADLLKEYDDMDQNFQDERPGEKKKKKKSSSSTSSKSTSGGGGGGRKHEALSSTLSKLARTRVKAKSSEEKEKIAQNFLVEMNDAFLLDEESRRKGEPGIKKLSMLSKVLDMLAAKDMIRVLLDYELLSNIKDWIEPLAPSGNSKVSVLGNITIREKLLSSVKQLNGEDGITKDDLKVSGLGKTVMTLYNHPDETKKMKSLCKGLIQQWSRPIFQKSGNYGDLQTINQTQKIKSARNTLKSPKSTNEAKEANGQKDGVGSMLSNGFKTNDSGTSRASVPFSSGFAFTHRPDSQTLDPSVARVMKSDRMKEGSIMDRINKKMINKNRPIQKNNQGEAVSLQGGDV